MSTVRLALPLRRHVGGAAQLEMAGGTVGECLMELERRFPGVGRELREESGAYLPSVNLYVNGQDVRYLCGQATPLGPTDELTIVIAIAGGAEGK